MTINSGELDPSEKDPTVKLPSEHAAEAPSITPNAVVSNPDVRRTVNVVLGIVGIIVGTVVVVDSASPAFDLSAFTVPIIAGYAYLASAFGLAVTVPNIPSSK